jgi:glycine/D-amino acid oxidase-like deaminating enzyme
VVGGGIIGTSVAYHLGKLGIKDVLLLEKDQLTSGTTSHAASIMTSFGSLSSASIDMRKYSRNAYVHDVSGWESPGLYTPHGLEPKVGKETFGRSEYFPRWKAEHKACRDNVALFDMSLRCR